MYLLLYRKFRKISYTAKKEKFTDNASKGQDTRFRKFLFFPTIDRNAVSLTAPGSAGKPSLKFPKLKCPVRPQRL
jgi:hypothetical protein